MPSQSDKWDNFRKIAENESLREGCKFPDCIDGEKPSFCGNCAVDYDPKNDSSSEFYGHVVDYDLARDMERGK